MLSSLTFDIEATDLSAVGAGIITHIGVKTERDGWMFRLDEYPQDLRFGFFGNQERLMLEDALSEMSKHQIWIGHNIAKFDIPFLRSRAYRLGMPWHYLPAVYDTLPAFKRTKMLTTRNYYGQPSAALDMIADFLGVPQQKTKIYPVEHWLQIWGNDLERRIAMDEKAAHCEADVAMTERAAKILWEHDPRAIIRKAL